MEHTQEEWEIQKVRSASDGNHTGDFCIWAKSTPKIATIHIRDVSVNEARANASLIRSAPKLLAACREFIEVCSYLRDSGNDDDPILIKAIKEGHEAISEATK